LMFNPLSPFAFQSPSRYYKASGPLTRLTAVRAATPARLSRQNEKA